MQKNDTFLIHGSKTEECIKFLHFSPLQIFGFFVIIKNGKSIAMDNGKTIERESCFIIQLMKPPLRASGASAR